MSLPVSDRVWLCDWDRRRKWRRCSLATGEPLDAMDEPPGEEANRRFMGFVARCLGRYYLVYRSEDRIWIQCGDRRARLDEDATKLSYRRRCLGLVSELRINGTEEARRIGTIRSFSLWRPLRPTIDPAWDDNELEQDDFLLWLANSSQDPRWRENVQQRWRTVEEARPHSEE